MTQEELEKAISAYPINTKNDLEKYLMSNQFDNMGNGIDVDGQIEFCEDKTFNFCENFDLGAMQKRGNFVDLNEY